MHNPVSQAVNRKNLVDLASLLRGCEYFPFFGTLLGLTRAGDIIPHDDDVDIYANISDRNEIITRLTNSGFKVDLKNTVNSSHWFLQAKRNECESESFVDFYFYEPHPDLGYVVERWNFSGRWKEASNHLHVPYRIIYPIETREFFGVEIKMPADPVKCCEYLYGATWQKPLMKRLGYTTKIVNHAPSIEVNPDQFSEVVRQFYALDETVRSQQLKLANQEQKLAKMWQDLIDANRRLVEAGEEIGRWQERTKDAERDIDAIRSTLWWRTRSIAFSGVGTIKSLLGR